MLLRTLPSLLLAATAAHALKNASPFFMLSSEPLRNPSLLHSQQLATAHDIEAALLADGSSSSSSTPTLYVLVSQAGITAADLQHVDSMPNMRRRISEAGAAAAVVEIPEVMGALDAAGLARGIALRDGARVIDLDGVHAAASAKLTTIREEESAVVRLIFQAAAAKHGKTLAQNDKSLDEYLSVFNPSNRPYTLIFTSTPPLLASASAHTDPPYEWDETYASDMHTDLKRDVMGPNYRRASNNSGDDDLTMQAGLPLFETYQFLSPAIFMGLTVTLLLFLILYVGVSAIAGLEVSYMAFSKEMGPKGQQPGAGKQ